jgi:hypothetical protein
VQDLPRIKLMPHSYFEKLKTVPIVIGHERCASSQFTGAHTLVVCALHGHRHAQKILHLGRYYLGCRECIEDNCPTTWAKTEEKARGLWENLET